MWTRAGAKSRVRHPLAFDWPVAARLKPSMSLTSWLINPWSRIAICSQSHPTGAATLADVREFGVAADFRAGLHCGRVAVGEVGSLKKEIALIGDITMSTAP